MSWSYSGDPSTSPLDEVRALIGDTDLDNPILTDEEIKFALSLKISAYSAAIQCCQYIIAKTAPETDYKVGPEQVSGSQLIDNYTKLLAELRKTYELTHAVPSADLDSKSIFSVGMFDCNRYQ